LEGFLRFWTFPYYTIPVAMLSLWTLLFATLIPRREAIGDSLALRQPVKA
jgi:hypothetical protein